MTELILGIVGAVLGCSTLLTALLYYSSQRRVKNAEARQKELETELQQSTNFRQQIQHLNEVIHIHTTTLEEQGQTIHRLNTALDGKTERIRELTDDLIKSESKTNRQNDKLLKMAEENAELKRENLLYKDWHCRRGDCQDPRGREPDNPKIKGKTFEHCRLATILKPKQTPKKG